MREVEPTPTRFLRRTRGRQRWYEALLDRMEAQHVLGLNCACVFLADGEDPKNPERQQAIEGLRRYLDAALEAGPATVLVSWIGDELREPERLSVSADQVRDLDFDSAWDRPFLVHVS